MTEKPAHASVLLAARSECGIPLERVRRAVHVSQVTCRRCIAVQAARKRANDARLERLIFKSAGIVSRHMKRRAGK